MKVVTRIVEVLAFPSVQLLDVTGPLQVFVSANDQVVAAGGTAPSAPRVVAQSGQDITTSAGLALSTHPLPPAGSPVDTLMVAGGEGVEAASADPVLVDWVRVRAGQARRTASVCTGAFLLAASGVLDGRRAATHWSFCTELARRYPAVTVEPDPIFIHDGPVWTSAGVTSGIDLALALVEEDLGRAVALAVARYLVVFLKRPGGQAQFSAGLALSGTDATFDRLHDWMKQNLRANLAVPALAEQVGMSERSFIRHYHHSTGITPARAVERIRVEAARQALGRTTLPLKRIARDCGFGSEETMRRSFLRTLSVPPHAYRERFPV